MKYKEIKEKSIEELQRLLQDLTGKFKDLKFKNANNQLKNIRQLREMKKNIAQLKTLIKQRQSQ